MTREIQLGKETLQILACASHVAFRRLALASQSQVSREFFIFTELHQSLTHNASILNLFFLIERKQFACTLLEPKHVFVLDLPTYIKLEPKHLFLNI